MKSSETASTRLPLVVAVRRKCSKGTRRNAAYSAVFGTGCGPVLLRLKTAFRSRWLRTEHSFGLR
jgi:hypothetical protein